MVSYLLCTVPSSDLKTKNKQKVQHWIHDGRGGGAWGGEANGNEREEKLDSPRSAWRSSERKGMCKAHQTECQPVLSLDSS